MNIVLVGYGRMGREVETVLHRRNHAIIARVDPFAEQADFPELTPGMAEKADAAIEFALAEGVEKNSSVYGDTGLPAVVGTTGWDDKRELVREMIVTKNGTLLWGSNFSVGAHVLFHLTAELTKIYDKLPDYDIFSYEIHHNQKKDSPSGTALRIGQAILENTGRKNRIYTDRLNRKIESDELHLGSIRGGAVPGTHSVLIDSAADTIEIKHSARTRSGFALGAVLAAEWLHTKKGFFKIEDFINDFLGGGHDI